MVWSGPLKGGIAIATIIGLHHHGRPWWALWGAEIVTFGMIALPAMLKRGYNKTIALGSITAGGGVATLIPPSIVFIVYAMMAGCSVGKLFIAGIIPGLLLAVLFILYIVYLTLRDPKAAPAAPPEERDIPMREKGAAPQGADHARSSWPRRFWDPSTGGVATPTEAAGIGCLGGGDRGGHQPQVHLRKSEKRLLRDPEDQLHAVLVVFRGPDDYRRLRAGRRATSS